jgi:F-type H+-transporting ATPase subunit b
MNGLVQQLGGLVLGSVPTIILFLVTLAAYQILVHAPLARILRERYARTRGAVEKAAAAIAAAEKKTAEYEERMRTARAAVFHVRHDRLHQVHVESELALEEARMSAQERTAAARVAIEDSVQAARLQMESMIEGLAARVLHAVLPRGNGPQGERAG